MKLEGQQQRLTIYIGESDKWHGKPLATALVAATLTACGTLTGAGVGAGAGAAVGAGSALANGNSKTPRSVSNTNTRFRLLSPNPVILIDVPHSAIRG